MKSHDAANASGEGKIFEKHYLTRQEILTEYYFLENAIDKFDEMALKIKSWSITASGVAIGFGYTEGESRLFLLSALGSLVFWYLESLWKIYQGICISRALKLEKILSSDIDDYSGPKIGESFQVAFKNGIEKATLIRTMWHSNVWVPHFFIFILGMTLYFRG